MKEQVLAEGKELVIGTRGSVLALWQAEYVKARLFTECKLQSRIQIVKTRGDKILDVPLAKVGGKGLFTKELEELLLQDSIDLAVHSLKDVPVDLDSSLTLAAITKREDSRDCFLSMKYPNLASLPKGAKVGTTSLRRSMQIKKFRKDLDTLSLRGNIQTRLAKLRSGEFDAIILALAGLNRLKISAKEVPHIKALEFMIPAMGQGALGIEMKKGNPYCKIINTLTHPQTVLCVNTERAFVRALNGGCQVPIAAHAIYVNNKLILQAMVGLPDGSEFLQEIVEDSIKLEDVAAGEKMGEGLAQKFIDKGARELLKRAEKMAFI